MWIHKSENTYNFSGIFTNINQKMLKVIMAEGEFVRWDTLTVMVILEVHCKGLWGKYCTDLTVNILKAYSSKPWINMRLIALSYACFRLVNTVQWGMHALCMGKVHVTEHLGKGLKQKYYYSNWKQFNPNLFI